MKCNQDIIEDYYGKNYRRLVKSIYFKVWNEADAEDIVQDAFTKALKYQDSYKNGNFSNWFSKILLNAFRTWKSVNTHHQGTEELDEFTLESIDPPSNYLKECISKWESEEDQEFLILYYEHGFSALAISQIMNVHKRTVWRVISRFKGRIKSGE